MLIQLFTTLPPWISYQGINCELQLINDGGGEARLVYDIGYADSDSPHKADIDSHRAFTNTFLDKENPPFTGFLWLVEGIYETEDLYRAIFWTAWKLGKEGLLK